MELLLKKMCEKTFEIANARQAKTVNTSHMWVEICCCWAGNHTAHESDQLPNGCLVCRKSCVMSDEMLDFLKETVASAPDLAPEEATAAKPAKRRR